MKRFDMFCKYFCCATLLALLATILYGLCIVIYDNFPMSILYIVGGVMFIRGYFVLGTELSEPEVNITIR